MLKRSLLLTACLALPLSSFAWGLQYRVTNASTAVVKFNSTDWFDWGTRVYSGQTKYNTYYFPPKNMYLTIYNYDGSRFTINTSSGCDLAGLPPLRNQSNPVSEVKGSTVRFVSGTVDIVVKDLPGSTHTHKSLGCSLVVSE